MKRMIWLLLLAAPLATSAMEPPKTPAEVQKTVDAFAGRWSLATTMTTPGAKTPTKFAEKLDCKRVSGGRAVVCTETAKVPGLGAMDFTHLISYDEERKAVHWFAVGSTGEVHDHTCRWSDDKTLDCGTFKATMGGVPMTQVFKAVFDGNKVTLIATTTTPEGDTKLESAGKRGG